MLQNLNYEAFLFLCSGFFLGGGGTTSASIRGYLGDQIGARYQTRLAA